jgi:hypothetical protein
MGEGHENDSRSMLSRVLSMGAIANAVLWALSIIALVFVVQRCPSARGLFVILAVGLGTALVPLAVPRKEQ